MTSSLPVIKPVSTSSGSRTTALADSDKLRSPAVITQEIVQDLQPALEQFKLIAGDLGAEVEDAL